MGTDDKAHENGNNSNLSEKSGNGSSDVTEYVSDNGQKTESRNPDEITDVDTVEGQTKKLKYPKAVGFIISNEFCERFNYYGMRTILVLYLSRELGYDDNTSTVIYHIFTMFCYFLCIFGAIIADSWLGKFRTILYLSIVYVIGSILITLGAIPPLNLPGITFTMLGLSLIALGSGGIKPCVSAFGGDQFVLPEQAKQVVMFFSLFYFSINSGSLISTTITPILREDVHCFGENQCYSLAFGVPAILMTVSVIIFVLGKPLYKQKPPAGNMFVTVSKTIGCAIASKCKSDKKDKKEHWLDYAECKYDKQSIDDIKVLLRVLVLYIPLPVFWALFDQQASRWTFQATRMFGDFDGFSVKPDQMQMLNPLLILVFIPLYDVAFYPLLSKIGLRRPLQKLTLGGILAGVAFIISAVVEIQLESTYPVLPQNGQSQLRIFNGVHGCPYSIQTDIPNNNDTFILKSLEQFEDKYIDVTERSIFNVKIFSNVNGCPSLDEKWELKSKTAVSVFLEIKQNALKTRIYDDNVDKPSRGSPVVRVLANTQKQVDIIWKDTNNNAVKYKENNTFYGLVEMTTTNYKVFVDDVEVLETQLKQGGAYTFLVGETSTGTYDCDIFIIAAPNSMNILWLIPQYVVMTLGEVMFSVTGLEFSYAQSPLSMKSVLQACWMLTVAFGNVIVVIIAELKLFESQANEFFLFAGLMFVDMIIFAILAYYYKPNNPLELLENSSETGDNKDEHKASPIEFKTTNEEKPKSDGLVDVPLRDTTAPQIAASVLEEKLLPEETPIHAPSAETTSSPVENPNPPTVQSLEESKSEEATKEVKSDEHADKPSTLEETKTLDGTDNKLE